MGKVRKKHNWKARENLDTKVDRSEEFKIKVDKECLNVSSEKYDASNALVLPTKKRTTKTKGSGQAPVKQLSKKQKKKLGKVLERKEKKVKRVDILEKLQNVQATPQEMALFISTSEMQSGREKRHLELEESDTGQIKINSISGINKKSRRMPVEEEEVEEESDTDYSSSDSEIEASSDTNCAQDINDSKPEDTENNVVNKDLKTVPDLKPTSAVKPAVRSRPVTYVPVDRDPEIQVKRLKLPIIGEEQVVMETINEHPVVVLCGETGSGKTTQVPQFLYEAGYATDGQMIAVTEPRRVAAISMSRRVAEEMNLSDREVSYQIRYEGNVTDDTKIKFMTDGVLLKEVQKDFLLSRYSVVILDEAHERSVYTDILIGLLSRIVPLRHKKGKPLKLIIMSATLRVEDFTENERLFKVKPPVINIESRQYPVTIHFNKRTALIDYVGEAYKKVCKIHRQLPAGGILVFVTGQQEVHTLCAKLQRTYPYVKGAQTDNPVGSSKKKEPVLPKVNLDDYSSLPLDEEAEIHNLDEDRDAAFSDASDAEGPEDGDSADEKDSTERVGPSVGEQPMYVLPLYSLLSPLQQAKVFHPPPEGTRLCVVATNVAETSITIPSIHYVIDTGRVKTKYYDKVTGISAFKVTWTSKASANQRAGRAGRTGPGHTYRLYSSAIFNDDFEQFSAPEITRRPVEDLVLQMKSMSIDKVTNFPFPCPPDVEALKAAEKLLVMLGALEKPKVSRPTVLPKKEVSSCITPLGRAMACFPVAPRYGKMLSLGHQHQLLPYVVAIVAALSVQEVFSETEHMPADTDTEKEEQKQRRLHMLQIRRTWAGSGHSRLLGDLMVLLKAVGACEFAGCSTSFCEQHGVRYKAMCEVRKLRAQLTNTVNGVLAGADLVLDPNMAPPTELQAKLLRQITLAGLADHVARKLPNPLPGAEDAKTMRHAYQCSSVAEPVFIHPSSVMYHQNVDYIIYQSIDETSKLYMKGVSAVEPDWLPVFASSHCQYSKPLEDPPPTYCPTAGCVLCHRTCTFGPHVWAVPAVEMEFPESIEQLRWFARFLLEGVVFPKLKQFTPVLLSPPVTMVKSWAKLQPRTEILLKALAARGVDNKAKLEAVWESSPQYLYEEWCSWLPQSCHVQLESGWPPSGS